MDGRGKSRLVTEAATPAGGFDIPGRQFPVHLDRRNTAPMSRRPLLAAALALPALALSACATVSPEAKVRASLMDAGLSPRMAGCMAERMVDRLSIGQLKSLKSLSSLPGADYREMTVDRLLYKLRALEDPEVFSVTSRAALACAIAP